MSWAEIKTELQDLQGQIDRTAQKLGQLPRFQDAKKVIAEYTKATKDLRGALDLMLTYVECGREFTNDFMNRTGQLKVLRRQP